MRRTTMINPLSNMRLTLAGLLVVVGVGVAAPRASAAPACGTTWKPYAADVWSSPDNWTNGVPNAATVACIPQWGSVRQIVLQGTAEAAGLVVGPKNQLVMSGSSAELSVGGAGIEN